MIPKQIFQTYPDVSNIPKPALAQAELFMDRNKDFKHTIFEDAEIDSYVHDYFDGDILLAYNQLANIVAKTDFWRYLIMYQDGGVYLDMDATIVCTLSHFLNETDAALISSEPIHGYHGTQLYAQWALVFEPQHPMLEKVIEVVTRNICCRRYDRVHALTGPTAFSRGVKRYFNQSYGQAVSWEDVSEGSDFTVCKDDICTRCYGRNYRGVFKHKYKGHEELTFDNWREKQEEESVYKLQVTKQHQGESLFENEHGRFYMPNSHCSRPVYHTLSDSEVWERETIDFITANSDGKSIVHAGAYIGEMLPGLSAGVSGTIYAFEPVPKNYEYAVRNIELNKLDNVVLENKALSRQQGHVDMVVSTRLRGELGGGSRVSTLEEDGEVQTVEATTLDSYLPKECEVSVIHLDTEGYEWSVIRGALHLIEQQLPIIISESPIHEWKTSVYHTKLMRLGYCYHGRLDYNNNIYSVADSVITVD